MKFPSWIKPGVWGGVIGAVAITFLAFNQDWVVTQQEAVKMAERQSEQNVIAALTPICIAQFKSMAGSEATAYLAALEGESSWQRGDYVEKQGWATMAGSEKPSPAVADACAEGLMSLAAK